MPGIELAPARWLGTFFPPVYKIAQSGATVQGDATEDRP